jgi:hypothetical protein
MTDFTSFFDSEVSSAIFWTISDLDIMCLLSPEFEPAGLNLPPAV